MPPRSCPDRLPDLAAGDDDHLDPRLLVVDRARGDEREVLVVLGDGADVVQRLLVGLARKDFPDDGIPPRVIHTRVLMGTLGIRPHETTIPSPRIVSRASSRMRPRVHTGSQTTSMRTSSTSGSASRRSRMSSWMNSIAGQPMAVKVSSRSTARSSSR